MKIAVKYRILALAAPIALALDLWTKAIVVERFHLGETIPILTGFFNLTYVRNTGAAFGMLADADARWRAPFFIVIPFFALGVIGYVFRRIAEHERLLAWGLSLVVSGAIGNLIDRARLGYVIDFLDFHWQEAYHFPAFNVADSAICVGVGLLMLDLLRQPNDRSEQAMHKNRAG